MTNCKYSKEKKCRMDFIQKVVDLRMKGLTYDEIAISLNISFEEVVKAFDELKKFNSSAYEAVKDKM